MINFLPKINMNQILTEQALRKLLQRVIHSDSSIESKVRFKDLAEAQIRKVEQTEAWKAHAKMHEGAKLRVIDPEGVDAEEIQNSLDILPTDYKLAEDDVLVTYGSGDLASAGVYGAQLGLGHSPSHSGDTYISMAADPNNKEFWMGCTCGVTVKSEDNDSGFQVKTYGASTESTLGYGQTSSNVSYGTISDTQYA